MENQTSAFVEEDGGFIPSAALLEKIRANPGQYPDAAHDFSKLSGGRYTEEQAQRMIEGRDLGVLSYGLVPMVTDLGQGALEGAAVAAEKLFGGGGEFIRSIAESADPKFSTDKGVGETLTETAGQVAPAVAATLTGGWTGVLAGIGIEALTFSDDENIINLLDQIAPNLTPDALVVQEDDTEAVGLAKHLFANLISEGAVATIAAVGKRFFKALAKGDEAEIAAAAEEAIEAGVRDVYQSKPKIAESNKVPEADLDALARSAVESSVRAKATAKAAGESIQDAAPVPQDYAASFLGKVGKQLRNFEGRTVETTNFGTISTAAKLRMAEHANEVISALYHNKQAEVVKLLKRGAKLKGRVQPAAVNSLGVYNTILTRVTLEHLDTNFETVVRSLRANPDQKTRVALSAVASDYLKEVGEIWDLYRNMGTSASYQLLVRKGVVTPDVADDFLTSLDGFDKELKELGITLRDNKATFVSKKILALEEAGVDAANFIESIYKMFDEFEAQAAGKIENLKQRTKLTPIEKLGMIGKGVQMLKDAQSTMLLGQFMTAGTEVISTGINALILPALRVAGGGSGRQWAREMAGLYSSTALARGNAWQSFKKGKDVTDDFFKQEGAFSRILDHESMSLPTSMLWRVFSIAVDTAQASASFFKTARAYGIAYADGLEAALSSGMTKKEAVASAKKFAASRFDENGAIIDEDLRMAAAQSAFQQHFDGSTLTGRLGQWVENRRNSPHLKGLEGVAWRSAMPFFRTLANIGSNGAQMTLPPAVSVIVKRAFPDGTHVAKFLDDFSGKNGQTAAEIARGRNRIGMALAVTGFGVTQLPNVELTGPSRGKRWDAKKRSFEVMPASSIIIGETAVDLTRFLPFSAPLLLAGTLRDYQLEDNIRMVGGEYDPEDTTLEYLGQYISGWAVTTATLLQDAGASRGVTGLIDAIVAAAADGNAKPLLRYGQQYSTQFTPGPLKMINKAGGDIEHEGYDFLERWKASAGLETGYERLDFLGHPMKYPGFKGIDPSNRRVLNLDDPVYAEFAHLNRMESLALTLPKPDGVFNKAFWKQMGVNVDGFLGAGNVPSLTKLKTASGANAWDTYRTLVYKGKVSKKALQNSTSKYGDRVSVGSVQVRPGENFETAIRRITKSSDYLNMSLDARAKVWKATFGVFKKAAKEHLSESVRVDPSLFERSRYGSPITQPATLGETSKAAKDLASSVQRSVGSNLDAAFAP